MARKEAPQARNVQPLERIDVRINSASENLAEAEEILRSLERVLFSPPQPDQAGPELTQRDDSALLLRLADDAGQVEDRSQRVTMLIEKLVDQLGLRERIDNELGRNMQNQMAPAGSGITVPTQGPDNGIR